MQSNWVVGRSFMVGEAVSSTTFLPVSLEPQVGLHAGMPRAPVPVQVLSQELSILNA